MRATTVPGQIDDLDPGPPSEHSDDHLDWAARRQAAVAQSDGRLFERLRRRLDSESLILPQIPATAARLLDLTSDPSIEFADLAGSISGDPMISAELIRTANSALLAGRCEAASVADALRRVGIRGTRALILGLVMRGVIFRDESLLRYADEVWRQSVSLAALTRAIAPLAGIDADRAYLMGLLADLGKVALVALLERELRADDGLRSVIHTGVVGECFWKLHEEVGMRTAGLWNLPPELISVIGHHHAYYTNETHPREAALLSLAHRLDLALSRGDREEFLALQEAREMDFLRIEGDGRRQALSAALRSRRD